VRLYVSSRSYPELREVDAGPWRRGLIWLRAGRTAPPEPALLALPRGAGKPLGLTLGGVDDGLAPGGDRSQSVPGATGGEVIVPQAALCGPDRSDPTLTRPLGGEPRAERLAQMSRGVRRQAEPLEGADRASIARHLVSDAGGVQPKGGEDRGEFGGEGCDLRGGGRARGHGHLSFRFVLAGLLCPHAL